MRRTSRTWLLIAWTCLPAEAVFQSERSTAAVGSLQLDKPTSSAEPKLKPAKFNATAAQVGGACAPPFLAGNSMYLTALGSSVAGGQWGAWQLSDDPDSPVTATWKLDFMAPDWQTLRVFSDSGTLAAVTKPIELTELQKQYGWAPVDGMSSDGLSEKGWEFMDDLWAPALAYEYDAMKYPTNETVNGQPSYFVAKEQGSYPPTYTAAPELKDAAFGPAQWQLWAATDCKDVLVAVFKMELTEGERPGRMIIYNQVGQIAAKALTDPVVARFQFVDINKRLLATAESPALGSSIPMMSLPRRASIGNILPYTLHFERGGYNLSSSLLKEEFRWIIGSAIQVRALQDAHSGFVPPFIKDRYLLLSIVLSLVLTVGILIVSLLTGSLRTASRIFFYRDKAGPGFNVMSEPPVV